MWPSQKSCTLKAINIDFGFEMYILSLNFFRCELNKENSSKKQLIMKLGALRMAFALLLRTRKVSRENSAEIFLVRDVIYS